MSQIMLQHKFEFMLLNRYSTFKCDVLENTFKRYETQKKLIENGRNL